MHRLLAAMFIITGTIFELVQDNTGTNLLIKCDEDRTINVASRTRTIVEFIQDIIITNDLTKFPEDWTINVSFRVLRRKNAPPSIVYVFQLTGTIFKSVQDIIGTNLLTKFNDDRTINVASRVKNVFQPTETIFELIQDIIATNFLAKFHEDRTIIVATRVLERKMPRPLVAIVLTRKNVPHPGRVAIRLISENINIMGTNLLTNVNKKNAPPPGGYVFQQTRTIFEVVQDIIGSNHLHNWIKIGQYNVAYRPYKEKCPNPGGIVFQQTETIFELVQHYMGINLLTIFISINVASYVFKTQMLTPLDARRTKGDHKSSP
ncbi:hypothetical protein DPMN_120539 [Dreissena polymorpha]|uniref:Uncharacterized protein n=1 Tax=Dreissena polymorpha TaxID=45954 RepID=A0A9D4GL12_DREPO|nr:hypothetical protein DPMN_120539 [Dreissena polymorpha]